MQSLTSWPRNHLTDAAVKALIETSSTLRVRKGCELLDMRLQVVGDISDYFQGGHVERAYYADVHGGASFVVDADLDWGTALLRPYMELDDGTTRARFNLGAYFTNVPKRSVRKARDVGGVDILDALDDPTGTSFGLARGANILDSVEDIFQQQGYVRYVIERTQGSKTLPAPKTWIFEENLTWLRIVNELLKMVGYGGVYSDWNGYLRAHTYISPRHRPWEWYYSNLDLNRDLIGTEREHSLDIYRAPNRWVFRQTNVADGFTPKEGNGIYTYVNQTYGPTSVEARGGREISKPVGLDAADHASLVKAAQAVIDADIDTRGTFTMPIGCNPLHWHGDKVYGEDPALGLGGEIIVSQWKLPLNGEFMAHEWMPLANFAGVVVAA